MHRKPHDPLAGRSETQRLAAEEFRRIFELADKRPDKGVHNVHPLSDDQSKAWKSLAACYKALGQAGSALTNDAMIRGMSIKRITEARGMTGPTWERYHRRRLDECLDCLAAVFGFAGADNRMGEIEMTM